MVLVRTEPASVFPFRANSGQKKVKALSNTTWLVGGLAIAAIILAVVTSWYRRGREPDLGTVSHQWMAEQRLGGTRDRHGS